MEAEPTKADPPKRKRRWSQFSLRSLPIGVTLMAVPCAYVGWQAKIVRERKQELGRDVNGRWEFLFEGFEVVGPNPISPLRRMLGDVRIMAIEISPETELEERAHLVALCPESDR